MKLDEAIKLLKNSNYIVEFTQTSIPPDTLLKLIRKEFGIDFRNVTSTENTYITLGTGIKIDRSLAGEISHFIRKYGYLVDHYCGNTISIEPLREKLYKPSDFKYFAHMSYAPPQIVFKTGLRCKSKDRRLYFFAFHNKEELDNAFNHLGFRTWPKEVDASSGDYHNTYGGKAYLQDLGGKGVEGGFYTYIFELPKNTTIHKDLEYYEDEPDRGIACYIYEPVPPQNIKEYIGSDAM